MESQEKVAEAPVAGDPVAGDRVAGDRVAGDTVDQLQSRAGMGAALPRPRLRSEHLESAAQVKIAALAAADRKADDLLVLEVAKCCDFTDHFLICSGSNERQVHAIADAILEALHREGIKPLHVEGLPNARWVLLDFGGDFVAHVFVDSARRFYDLERLWSDAPNITERLLAAEKKA